MMRAAQHILGKGADALTVELVPRPSLKDGEVLIKVASSALNRADIIQRNGNYPVPPGGSEILGLEVAGVIEEMGPSTDSGSGKFVPGDRVMALLNGGGYAEYAAAHASHLMRIPPAMEFNTAAAIPEVWLTAFQLLVLVGRIQPKETVLVHAGASGVGTAAIQLITKVFHGKAIATAGSDAKVAFIEELGAKGINYKTEDFSEKVAEFTNGQGVDIVLDCIGSSYWTKNVKSLALDGRWVLFGLMGGVEINGPLLASVLRKRIQLTGSTLRSRSVEYKANLIDQFVATALPLILNGTMTTVVDSVFPLDQVGEAHKYLEDNRNIGKVILTIQELITGTKSEL